MRIATLALPVCALLAACGSNTPAKTLPPAPTGLVATGGVGQVTLTWTPAPGADSYVILRGDASDTEGPMDPPATSAAPSYTDTTVAAGQTYFYAVQTVKGGDTSVKSAEASAVTAPPAPANLTVTTTDTGATVQWSAAAGATSYEVLRAPGGTTTFAPVGTTSATSLADSGLTPNTPYVYAVRAKNGSGTSTDATADATTAPVAPTAVSATASNHHVTVTWTAAAGAGPGGYRVWRATASGGPYTAAGTSGTNSFTDTLLANGTTYFYVVHTIGGSGESGNSNEASARPFIEICTLDSASYAVSTFDGQASGDVAPKRSFGWGTGIANGTGIATDGTNLYVASQYTNSIDVYPRTVSGNTAPTTTIALPAQPTALALDTTNSEIYAAAGDSVYVYSTAAGAAFGTLARQLTTGTGVHGLGLDLTHGQLFVVQASTIVVYKRTDSGAVTPQNTILPTGVNAASTPVTTINSSTVLYGGAYDPNDDTIWVVWDDENLNLGSISGYAASYSRTGSGSTDATNGPTTSSTSLHPWVHPRGVAVDGTTEVWISNADVSYDHSKDAFYRFKRTSGTAATLDKGYIGANTGLYNPTALFLDSANSEIWLVNGQNGAAAFDTAAPTTTGLLNIAPNRSLDDVAGGLLEPLGLAVDRIADELVVLTNGPDQSIEVFPRTATGSPPPARTIAGPVNTTLSGTPVYDLVVDEVWGEYWVEGGNNLTVFSSTASGDVAPARSPISGASTNLGLFHGLAFDGKAGNVVVASEDTSNSTATLMSWPRDATGNVAAFSTATLSILPARWLDIDPAHDLIFASSAGANGFHVSAFPRSFGSGPLAAVSSFVMPGSRFTVDGEGSEIYAIETAASGGSQIAVYPSTGSGTPSPARVIAGASTGLKQASAIVVCN